jgi:hypothetical protein
MSSDPIIYTDPYGLDIRVQIHPVGLGNNLHGCLVNFLISRLLHRTGMSFILLIRETNSIFGRSRANNLLLLV